LEYGPRSSGEILFLRPRVAIVCPSIKESPGFKVQSVRFDVVMVAFMKKFIKIEGSNGETKAENEEWEICFIVKRDC
jgi:hypothetical protein